MVTFCIDATKSDQFWGLDKRKTPVDVFYEDFFVPRAGVEPARVAPLVFETSASTDSAIWAASKTYSVSNCGAKVGIIFRTAKL